MNNSRASFTSCSQVYCKIPSYSTPPPPTHSLELCLKSSFIFSTKKASAVSIVAFFYYCFRPSTQSHTLYIINAFWSPDCFRTFYLQLLRYFCLYTYVHVCICQTESCMSSYGVSVSEYSQTPLHRHPSTKDTPSLKENTLSWMASCTKCHQVRRALSSLFFPCNYM